MHYRSVLRSFAARRVPGILLYVRVAWPWWLRAWWWFHRRFLIGSISISGGWLRAFGFAFFLQEYFTHITVQVCRVTPFGIRPLRAFPLAPFLLALVLLLQLLGIALGALLAHVTP